ncbi:right-handed parallel beta-helix repeat-containing protein [Motilibacter aurantiacus]|uniref:right-handed parallel beta-helix repeat-containing protein n=1 Tax=Motilibacter aurantiacus TaxID=2714955 RepID=UPI00140B902C|nr:right-handed parallel beta-helix repeat-containing protein [Motilibacter aurantiacus]NHC45009.1 hypothetical protein [Motilibacter aurantiacus]
MRKSIALLGLSAALAPATLAATLLAPTIAQAATTSLLVVDGRPLDKATVAPASVVSVAADGATSVRWSVDGGDYVTDAVAPFALPLNLQAGEHRVRARVTVGGDETRLDAKFEVASATAAPSTPAPSAPAPTPPSAPAPAPATPAAPAPAVTLPAVPAGARVVKVATADALVAALAAARPGDVIELADGTYQAKSQLEASANGTRTAPITLRGSRKAVLTTGTASNKGYGLHITGDFWKVEGLKVDTAKKGIILDNSVGTVLYGVEVSNIGQEAVHFRDNSSDGAIYNSDVHDTGLKSPAFGEGIYVGSAVSNWGTYSGGQADRSDRVIVEGNRVWNTTAEGIDAKEGTTGGVIRNNRFDNAGYSGENSADSWVDVKGNGWLVEGNTGRGTLLDAFQTHVVASGWGQGNTFTRNVVEGGVPGVVVGIYPKPSTHGNIVRCDNVPASAAQPVSNIGCAG